ncbi:MAG: C39 family peptidase, partial [Terriglobales bacterium]
PVATEEVPSANQKPIESSLGKDPNSFFLSQFYTPQWNPDGPSASNNCGPASLAMACKAFGELPPGADANDPERLIESVREAMTGNRDNSQLTSYEQIEAGAQRSGLKAQMVVGLDNIDQSLSTGAMVVAGGNPARAWGSRLASADYAHFNGGHFVLIVGKNGDNYTVNDPLSKTGSITVSSSEMQAYLSDASMGYGEGVAVWK